MSDSKSYNIEVVRFDGDEVVQTIGPVSEHMLERTMMGLLRNMDTERFYVREVEA